LEHVIERSVLICDGDVIFPEHLYLENPIRYVPKETPAEGGTEPDLSVQAATGEPVTLKEMEKTMIFDALRRVKGNRTQASKILGISVRTMRNKLQEYESEGEAIPSDS